MGTKQELNMYLPVEHFILIQVAKVIALVLAFLAPINSVIFAVTIILVFDFITGIWAVIKTKGWSAISSRRMADSISKIVLYNVAIITSHLVQEHLLHEVPFVRIAAGIIGLTEIKSVFENVGKITNSNLWNQVKKTIDTRISEKPARKSK